MRTSWQVTQSVWHALFLREAVSRTMADRLGWFWMIAEPAGIVAVMVAIRGFIRGGRLIDNAEFIPWLILGLLGFFLVRDGMLRGMAAIETNASLFSYRQVKPIDPVLARNFVEGMLRTVVLILFILGGLMLGWKMNPDDALMALFAWFSLWCLGLGLGLVASVVGTLIPEIAKIIRMLSLPLLILSGVIIPLHHFPHWLLEYLMLNPIPHGLEMFRLAFFERYHTVPGTSILYFWLFTLSVIALGLLMHIRYADKLKAK